MARYLMTHSLLASWQYSMKDNPYEDATNARDTYAEFMQVLRRQPTETTEAMQKGIDFENLVTSVMTGGGDPKNRWYLAAKRIADTIDGGRLQFRAVKNIEVSGLPLVLYGRLDALKAGVVYDIKFSGSYDVGKYFSSTQHPTYLELVPEAREFTYLVSNGSSVWPETYRRDETKSIYPIIADFFSYLRVQGLMDIYKEHWLAR